jgi:DNA-binding CsgD family transcriptional regulator
LTAALGGETEPILLTEAGVQLSVRNMGRVGIGETMLLLEQRSANGATPSRLANAALTPRETEVLSWLAKGKTNRDIGDILGMSHRTVNKHLEHIFEKLGVETRAAAAALATGHMF